MVAQREAFYYATKEDGMEFNKERQRPAVLGGVTEKMKTAGGTMYVTVSVDEYRRPVEVFIRIGKMGEIEHAHLTGLGRVLSYALRTGADPQGLIDSLAGIASEPRWNKGELVLSAEDGVAKMLRRVIEGEYDERLASTLNIVAGSPMAMPQSKPPSPEPVPIRRAAAHVGDRCHACGGRAVFQEGCMTCLDCNYSKCE